jgi:hypothetical protein
MILTDLLGSKVFGPDFLGYVTDARFVLDPPSSDQPMPTARLYGLVVSPHSRSSSLGFERIDVSSPWPIAAALRWRHRGAFLVAWADIARIDPQRVQLRNHFTRRSSLLREPATRPPDLG